MKVIGLTGGIGAGKSTVSKILYQKYGIPVMDADEIAKNVVEPGLPAMKEIERFFGQSYLTENGSMNREKMGELIRKDTRAKANLERIIHHYVGEEVMDQIKAHQEKNTPILVYDCPLLFEAGADEICDRTALVMVDFNQRLKRLMERDGIDRETALAKMAIQMADEEKIARADDIIDNNGDLEHLLEEINHTFKKWESFEV